MPLEVVRCVTKAGIEEWLVEMEMVLYEGAEVASTIGDCLTDWFNVFLDLH